MRALFWLAILSVSAAMAEQALRIDLSGDWRMSPDDKPEYAATQFDDGAWPALRLPRGAEYFHGMKYWLRRRVDLPAGTDRSQLALTLGTLQDVYEVYVNGRRIGATGSFDSFEDARIPQPLTFDIPLQAAQEGEPLQIALRVRGILFYHPHWRMLDVGPYLLTYRDGAPTEAGRQQLEHRWVTIAPHFVFGTIFAVIGLLSLFGWLSERERIELLWFVFVSFARAVAAIFLSLQLLADSHPFNRLGIAPEFVYGNMDTPLFVEFVFAALGIRSWKLRLALWLGWLGAPISLYSDSRSAIWTIGFPAYVWVSCLGLLVIVWDWWKLSHRGAPVEQHVLHLALALCSGSFSGNWIVLFWTDMIAFSQSVVTFKIRDVPGFPVGPFRVQFVDVFWLLVSATILALLFRRLAADRRERQRLSSELEAARVIQQLLLKQPELRERGLSLEAVYAPAQEVGGDFYYVLDGQVVVIGDVSGKGLKAAMLVSLLIGVLRRDTGERRPGAVLEALNRALAGHIDGFVTCCCARFDAGGEVVVANAGHLSPYVDGAEVAVDTSLPLGLDAGCEYGETALTLAPGSSITFLSDGVVEAANAKGELFGFERTSGISTKAAAEIAEAAKAWGQNDDITVVTVRRTV
jgi:sigma-B regulation protein RsbU (phosphoserine phosphatase)